MIEQLSMLAVMNDYRKFNDKWSHGKLPFEDKTVVKEESKYTK